MHLTPPTPRAGRQRTRRTALTTIPGFVNRNLQEVIVSTGYPSTSFPGQMVYKLKCRYCKAEYGANGCDIHIRRCPNCQNGEKGERLLIAGPNLFDQ